MVFCENRNLEVVKDSLLRELGYQSGRDFEVDTRRLVEMHKQGSSPRELLEADIGMSVRESSRRRVFPNVDGIKFLSHQGGCGSTPNDLGSLLALLAGYVTHPNVAGATILSLGCQQAQSEFLLEEIRKLDPSLSKPLFFLEQQQSKSERDFIAEAVKKTFVGLIEANEAVRQPAGLKKLVVGLECGGSDGFSGISANPAPGNIRDGLITDAMKSAGAARKGGTSPIVAVLDYTEQVTKPGLNLLCTPGNDVESTTGLAGSGANLIVFTTGLGTPTGNVVAPTIKVSSNSNLFDRMSDIIDIDAGTIITGRDTIETKGEEILDFIIDVASGEKVARAVALGQEDFIPWKRDNISL